MGSRYLRFALWALVVILVATPAATLTSARAASPNYTLSGYVNEPGGTAMPKAGVTVELLSPSTGQNLTTVTQAGGLFSFTGSGLTPGWWGLWVPPQAHLQLGGGRQWAVLPNGSSPQDYSLSAANLTSGLPQVETTATLLELTGLVEGNVTFANGAPAAGASIDLLAPTLAGFDLNNTTANASGGFSLYAPPGTWILQTTYAGASTQYNTTEITVGSRPLSVSPVIESYVAQGNIYQRSSGARVALGGNVTLYDTATRAILSGTALPGSYSIGTYPAGFTGPGAESFVVLVSPSGYGTVGYSAQVSRAAPSLTRNVYVVPQAPPADYTTTLRFAPTFGLVNISTVATLGNDSVFTTLANASVGQLWTQLGLDFNSGHLYFDGASPAEVSAFTAWLTGRGPFFAAGQAGLNVNGTTFGQPTNDTFRAPTIPASVLNYTSPNGLSMSWSQVYNGTGPVTGGGTNRQYTIAFSFRHPTGPQAINYTIDLPSGYTLSANTLKPANTVLVPEGPDRTWTNFTMVAKAVPAGQPLNGEANFTIVKYTGITAIVNVSTSSFDFSKANVLNGTRANYTVVVGAGQNTTFSALNTTYPGGTNGTLFRWNFGGVDQTTTGPVAWHTYTAPGMYVGSVNVTSSGGTTSQTGFTVWVGSAPPVPVIASNASAAEKATSGGVPYLIVNSSTTLYFNVTGSTSPLAANLTAHGVLADAIWSIAAHSYNVTANYSAGAGAQVNSNLTETFLDNGVYYRNATIGGQTVVFDGWLYNVTLTLWDGQGHSATATLPVVVRDKMAPTPVITLTNSAGTNLSASGLVESANHTAYVGLSGRYSTAPGNGSVVRYNWSITNSGNSSFRLPSTPTASKWSTYLPPQAQPYTVNLTVFDVAGNHAYVTKSLTVSINVSTRPVLSVGNLTAPSAMTDGSGYTIWANVTNTVGKNSTAFDVSVSFYLLNSGGTGSRQNVGSASQVQFYGYTNGVLNTTLLATGVLPKLAWNQTVRAEIHWTPGVAAGSYSLYVNATATNEFPANYGPNVASVPVSIAASPYANLVEYVVIVVIAAFAILVVVYMLRKQRNRPASSGRGSSSGSKGASGASDRSGKGSSSSKGATRTDDDEDDDT